MGGVLSHVLLSGILAFITLKIFKRKEYAYSIFIGNLAVDGIKILIFPFFWQIGRITRSFETWTILGLLGILICYILYKLKKISKNKFQLYSGIIVAFVIGTYFHLWFDMIYDEPSIWL